MIRALIKAGPVAALGLGLTLFAAFMTDLGSDMKHSLFWCTLVGISLLVVAFFVAGSELDK